MSLDARGRVDWDGRIVLLIRLCFQESGCRPWLTIRTVFKVHDQSLYSGTLLHWAVVGRNGLRLMLWVGLFVSYFARWEPEVCSAFDRARLRSQRIDAELQEQIDFGYELPS